MTTLSVILCTHNPRLDLLKWTVQSLAAQTDAPEDWELIIVDNRSSQPLDISGFLPETLASRAKLIREERPGLSAARCAGIGESRGETIVFVDDDNHLASNYLVESARIARDHPEIGCFGGKARPHFECTPSEWLKPILNNLGIRDYGNERITSREPVWGPWEPIGAGMVVRRQVALAFADYFRQHAVATELGRKGDSLASCEDSLIAYLSLQQGLANSYEPSLELVHFIKDVRVLPSYLSRLMLAMGRSYHQLQVIKGQSPPRPESWADTADRLLRTFPYRLATLADAGYVQWLWDVGHATAAIDIPWPRISVVVPTYNSGRTLRRTLESLKAQVYPALEVIVQDGCSKDDTLAIAADYRGLVTSLESGPDTGQADAINRGLARSTGEIEAWLCSDDEYRPGILFYVALNFLLNPPVDFLVGGCLRLLPDGCPVPVVPREDQLSSLGYHNCIDQPSTFWRRRLREKAGPIDQSFHYAFDWEYWNRFLRAGATVRLVPELLSVYHFSDHNKTSVAGSRQVPELVEVVRKYGPLNGDLARIYHLLYRRFDLAGCYDTPPSAPPSLMLRFQGLLRRLVERHGKDLIYGYNWTYASKQERKITWYK